MVLLVVDAQELITTDKLYMADRFIANVKQLIGEARANGVEVIYVRHDDGEGCELTKARQGMRYTAALLRLRVKRFLTSG